MSRVIMYMNEDRTGHSRDSTVYLHDRMISRGIDARILTEPDIDPAREADVVFCRFEIPIRQEFLRNLEPMEHEKLFINPPSAKRAYHTKHYLEELLSTGSVPPTRISDKYNDLAGWAADLKEDVVIKPLHLNKGQGIARVPKGTSADEIASLLSETGEGNEMMVQQFICGVEEYGDKRINVLFYEPVSAVLRMPPPGSFICNQSTGGSCIRTELSRQDIEIVERIRPFLEKNKILWAGVDVIGPYLGEINISSPGLLARADILNGNERGAQFMIDRVHAYLRTV